MRIHKGEVIMATKKKTEVEATEVVEEVKEEVVEEAPKKTSKKTSKKKEEEPIVEELTVEEVPVVEEPVKEPAPVVEEVKEEKPKKEEKKEEKKETFAPYIVQVTSPSGIYTFKNPGFDQPKGKVYPKGAKITVLEVKGNWARVGENVWILLSGAVVRV